MDYSLEAIGQHFLLKLEKNMTEYEEVEQVACKEAKYIL